MLDEFKSLPLWKHFVEDQTVKFDLDTLCESALSRLDLYYTAFPHFTLHNRTHQKNVLRIIGELLGDRVKDLSKLECAIVILSVFYHDIGMVFTETELLKIETEDSFQIFLNDNFKAKLLFETNEKKINGELAEWYCRWMHAKRVWLFIDELDKLPWRNINLKTTIGRVCESHNEDSSVLNDDEIFEIDYLGQADVKFCSILLRLGDILDFDNSRTPRSVYELLDLDNPRNTNEQISNNEWKKHLCSDGFRITSGQDLIFVAGPKHPQIEKNIHTFLDIITNELVQCQNVVRKCSNRWRNFQLPTSIDRKGIKSDNYKKGDFRFSLDENQIIKLLAGENLYDNGFVFIRELLQNSIDTSRMREYHERSLGNASFKAKDIEIFSWIDENGYRWVRVDDHGMGINEYVIQNHLLRKGNSFYNSDFFKIQKLSYYDKLKKDFTPISRFGIGLLSCFVLGDAIEINSRSVKIPLTGSEEEKVRLSIHGLQGQYFLQTEKEKHSPLPMPDLDNDEKEFRRDFGTSIAVRIDRSKDRPEFEAQLNSWIDKFVTTSPIGIKFQCNEVAMDFENVLNIPFSRKTYIPFSTENKLIVEEFFERSISEIGIDIVPIDVSKTSANENLKGQIVLIKLECDEIGEDGVDNVEFEFICEQVDKQYINFKKRRLNSNTLKYEYTQKNIEISSVFEKMDLNPFFRDLFFEGGVKQGLKLIHNGINIPNYSDDPDFGREPKISFPQSLFSSVNRGFFNKKQFANFGIIYFQDDLIPDLSVARNLIKRMGFSIYSALFFALRDLNNSVKNFEIYFNFLDNVDDFFSFSEIRHDSLIKNGLWDDIKLFKITPYESDLLSLSQIMLKIKEGPISLTPEYRSSFWSAITRGLLAIHFEVEYYPGKYSESPTVYEAACWRITKEKKITAPQSIDKFAPLRFIPFTTPDLLQHGRFVNTKHFLTQWMLSNQLYLTENFEGYFLSLTRAIICGEIDVINKIIEHFKHNALPDIKPNFRNISMNDYENHDWKNL